MENNENQTSFEHMKSEEITLPRYVKVKDSIESLMNVIDIEKAKQDGLNRVLTALLQLIDENDEKTIDEKYDDITEAIYKGNVFKNYFKEENKAEAVDILSKTSLLNDLERFIYIINFYMPDDVNFSNIYKELDKNIDKIIEYYNLPNNEGVAQKFVLGRISEIAKYHKAYRAEKDRQKTFLETEALAAMQDAEDNPSIENFEKVKKLLDEISNESLKTTLAGQLEELIKEYAANNEESKTEQEKMPIVEAKEEVPEAVAEEPVEIEPTSEYHEPSFEPPILEDPKPTKTFFDDRYDFSNQEPVKAVDKGIEIPIEPVLETKMDNVTYDDHKIEEPKFENPKADVSDNNVAEDVMTSLRGLVSKLRTSETLNEDYEAALKAMKEQNEALKAQIDSLNATVASQDTTINEQHVKINERETTIDRQNETISKLKGDIREKDQALYTADNEIATQNRTINDQNRTINEQNAQIASLNREVADLNKTVDSYKGSLTDIKDFLAGVQVDENSVSKTKVA